MAGLSKQHFKEIARIINKNAYSCEEIYPEENIKTLINDLSDYFKTQNPLFNENRFKRACLE